MQVPPRHRDWWADQLGPLADRVATVGVSRAAPASFALAVASLVATAAARLPGPFGHAAARGLSYRGADFYRGAEWKLPLSGLLSQSWPQWWWTLLMAVVLFATLEVRAGSQDAAELRVRRPGSVVLSTVVAAILAPVLGHAGVLARPDFGTSCLVVAAGLAWIRRSWLLTTIILISLTVDAFLQCAGHRGRTLRRGAGRRPGGACLDRRSPPPHGLPDLAGSLRRTRASSQRSVAT